MHTTISYEGLDKEAKQAKALKDMQEWFGSRWEKVLATLQKEAPSMNMREFRMALSFAGVQGYPVEVLGEMLGIHEAATPEAEEN